MSGAGLGLSSKADGGGREVKGNLISLLRLRPQLDLPPSPPSLQCPNQICSQTPRHPASPSTPGRSNASSPNQNVQMARTFHPPFFFHTTGSSHLQDHMVHRTRKELKIRPGFTPQEDVTRFRGTKQQEMDTRALPKGHIIGWVAPSSATNNAGGKSSGTMSKSQKKNEKKRGKKKADIAKKIQENWEDDDEDEIKPPPEPKATTEDSKKSDSTADDIAEGLEKLEVNN